MKKTVLTFGLAAGAFLSAVMLVTMPFHDAIGWDRSMLVGYTTMVLAFLMTFFGVRAYRDKVGGGTVRFGRGLAVGVLIGAVASVCYVATWEVLYFTVASDYIVKYQAHMLDKARADGESDAAIAQKKVEMERFATLYDNPAINAGMTFLEPMPVALIVAFVSAGVLSRRRKVAEPQAA
jgi:hypothetical protein